MTFNENVRIDTSHVQKRSGGRRTGMAVGGGGIGLMVVLFLGSQLLGVDLTGLAPALSSAGGGGTSSEQIVEVDECKTGADANANVECRMTATSDSLNRYWNSQVGNYRAPAPVVLFSGQTQSQCGIASSATGPFYCPPEEQIYVDTAFFNTLRADYGASGGPLAEMYVLAHEWGHHISNITGSLNQAGRESGATSGSVRLELQADCFAGAWVGAAQTVTDDSGVAFLKPVTQREINDALSAAAAVGDDHIMQSSGMRVDPERFTHGTSEQRQRWFMTGYEQGPTSCGTFDVSAANL